MSCYSLEFSQFIFGDLKVGEFLNADFADFARPQALLCSLGNDFWLGKLESGGKRWRKNPYPQAIFFTPTKFLWMKNATNKGKN